MRGGLSRGPTVNFQNINIVDDEYSSDGSEDEKISKQLTAFPSKTQSQLFTIDLSSMIDTHKLPCDLIHEQLDFLELKDEESNPETLCLPTVPVIPPRNLPVDHVFIAVAHLDQFPKPSSPYTASLPCIFSWYNTNSLFASEFTTNMQTYYKSNYLAIRKPLPIVILIAPTLERYSSISNQRRQQSNGRNLFHYIGYGFPDITSDNIWCSERRSTNFEPYDLPTIFTNLGPSSWFIFDCNKAGLVIPTFTQIAEANSHDGQHPEWKDWFCICATDENEDLPDDPHLPRDFLTSCILTPIKTAVICHILQNYRLTLVGDRFPFEITCPELVSDRSVEQQKLSMILLAICDAIAVEILPPDLFHQMVRSDRFSAVIFRHFLLAQYLLQPYHVHPVSYPSFPDSSMHPLWKKWSILLDAEICKQSIPRSHLTSDFFTRIVKSFDFLVRGSNFSEISPSQIMLTFHSIFFKEVDSQFALKALSSYTRKGDVSILSNTVVFYPLFQTMINLDKKNPTFEAAALLVLALLHEKPDFATEIRKELNVSNFPLSIFDHSLPESTRILITAVTASLVVALESFQQTCTTFEFLSKVKNELGHASANFALWLLLLVRRSFHLFSPDPQTYNANGLHVQIGMYLFHPDPLIRAAAVGAITCFLRPYECCVNGQLLMMTLHLVHDCSYFVRFHVLLMLKKFVTSFDSFSDTIAQQGVMHQNLSYRDLLEEVYKVPTPIDEILRPSFEFFDRIDNVVTGPQFLVHAYTMAMGLINVLCRDPAPMVSELAQRTENFIKKLRTAYENTMNDEPIAMSPHSFNEQQQFDETFSYCDDEFEEEHLAFASLDQNESLHKIALRRLIESGPVKLAKQIAEKPTQFTPNKGKLELKELSRQKVAPDGVQIVAFDPNHHGAYAAASKSSIIYVSEDGKAVAIPESTSSLFVISIQGKSYVIYTTAEGAVVMWNPIAQKIIGSFIADPTGNEVAMAAGNGTEIYTIAENGIIDRWDLEQLRILGDSVFQDIPCCLSAIPRLIVGFKTKDNKGVVESTKLNSPPNAISANEKSIVILSDSGDITIDGKLKCTKTEILSIEIMKTTDLIITLDSERNGHICNMNMESIADIPVKNILSINVHQKLSQILVGTNTGEVVIYKLIL